MPGTSLVFLLYVQDLNAGPLPAVDFQSVATTDYTSVRFFSLFCQSSHLLSLVQIPTCSNNEFITWA